MTAAELVRELRIPRAKLETWIGEGLPWRSANPNRKRFAWERSRFDLAAVRAWLIDAGKAREQKLVPTMQDVADYFRVSVRTVARWKEERAPIGEAPYDLAAIEEWRRLRYAETIGDPAGTRATWATERERLRVEREQLELDRLRGKIIDVGRANAIMARHITEVAAHLDQLPDVIASVLPEKCPAKTVGAIRKAVSAKVEALRVAIAEAVEDLADEVRRDLDEEAGP